jgi:hypothetical protein
MLRLEAADTCLKIDDRDPAHCQCWLLKNDKSELFLGEVDWLYIREHLLIGLRGLEQVAAGELDGITVTWAGNFAPLQYTLYFGWQDANTIIFVQDGKLLCLVARLVLSPEDVTQWLRLLGA